MKRILSFVLALTLLFTVPCAALAEGLAAPDGSDVEIIAIRPGDTTRSEETAWYFRVHNGMVQMRLWSLTNMKWLTDWIDVGPYEPY